MASVIAFLVIMMMSSSTPAPAQKDKSESTGQDVVFILFFIFALTIGCAITRYYIQRRLRLLRELRSEGGGTWSMTGRGRTALQLSMTDRDFDANDYDLLLQLDDMEDNDDGIEMQRHGLSEAEIHRLPTCTLPPARPGVGAAEEEDCVVCLDPKQPGNEVRTLPCLHQFHTACIDKWLSGKASCPICTQEVSAL